MATNIGVIERVAVENLEFDGDEHRVMEFSAFGVLALGVLAFGVLVLGVLALGVLGLRVFSPWEFSASGFPPSLEELTSAGGRILNSRTHNVKTSLVNSVASRSDRAFNEPSILITRSLRMATSA